MSERLSSSQVSWVFAHKARISPRHDSVFGMMRTTPGCGGGSPRLSASARIVGLRCRPRHSVVSDSVGKALERLGGHEARPLGRLSVKGSGRPASEPPIFGANQTVREVGGTIFPKKKRLFHGGLVLELNVRCIQKTR